METIKTQVIKFDLKALGEHLKSGPAWHEKRRNSCVLVKNGAHHVYLAAMHADSQVHARRTPCPMDIHVVEGRIRIATDRETLILDGGELAMLEAGAHYRLECEKESLLALEFFPSGLVHKTSEEEDDYVDNWV